MVDAEQAAVAGKGILKRRIRNEKPDPAPPACDDERCANVCKRNVTFDETISVKNDKDLVVKKPLTLVIENWKSGNAKTPSETFQPDPGIVQRLIDEFNTIEEPLTDILEIDSTLLEEEKVKEDSDSKEIQTKISLNEALETKAKAVKLTDGKLTISTSQLENRGMVNDLIIMFNSKSTKDKGLETVTVDC